MGALNLQSPLFATYVIAATLMILKDISMSWLTVVRMMTVKGGFRAPEDLKKTPLNPAPNPKQIEADERVECIRRIQFNDLENLPYSLVAGFLYMLTQPPLLLAQVLLYGFVVSRLLHFAAYLTARTHDTRAALWTVGSLILVFMTARTVDRCDRLLTSVSPNLGSNQGPTDQQKSTHRELLPASRRFVRRFRPDPEG